MSEDSKVVRLRQPEEIDDPLTGIPRNRRPSAAGAGDRGGGETAKLMVFKLITAAAKTRRRLRGENLLPKVIRGVTFRDGIEVTDTASQNAA